MTLKKWCDRYGHGAQAYLAWECGVRWATIHNLVQGGWATIATAKAVEEATDDEVSWMSLIDPKLRKELLAASRT